MIKSRLASRIRWILILGRGCRRSLNIISCRIMALKLKSQLLFPSCLARKKKRSKIRNLRRKMVLSKPPQKKKTKTKKTKKNKK